MPPLLTYCTNLFPSETLGELRAALSRFGPPLRRRLGVENLPLGLYVSAAAARELEAPGVLDAFDAELRAAGLSVPTLNAFPYGGFHGAWVKESVFRPTWEEDARFDYTLRACRILARLLPPGATGSVSTHTGTFKEFGVSDASDDRISRAWIRMSVELARLSDERGRQVILSVEPEPLSRLETTDEVLRFFERLRTGPLRRAAAEWSVSPSWLEAAVRRHLGVCFDACHQAVEFEDGVAAIARLRAAGIPIGKIQASVAPALKKPASNPSALARLHAFAEPRYLHQTFGRDAAGVIERKRDLPDALADAAFLRRSEEIRTHFHVPIFLDSMGELSTTRGELERVLATCGEATPCVEVETYTLSALPDPPKDDDAIVETMAREMEFAAAKLRP